MAGLVENSPMKPKPQELEALWAGHSAEWRAPEQIASQWREAADINPDFLRHTVRGAWWETLSKARVTLLVTREYEHLVMALSVVEGRPRISYFPVPHPSGLVVDRARGVVYLASTRNPNQIYDLAPVCGAKPRQDVKFAGARGRPLVPIRSRFLPGCLYLHDLALIGGNLFGNAVGENAVVHLMPDGNCERVWWPRCLEVNGRPDFGRNYLQLNSIAAGQSLAGSYFSASAESLSRRRPGHRNFPVDRRGVIFSGATREPIVRGLTRPHSARLNHGRVWVDNSGYGEVGFCDEGRFVCVARLSGWTRGLCFAQNTAFVGTSRVIPKFRQYAPGLDVNKNMCGIHAVDTRSGAVLGSLHWPYGNQIFAIDWLPASLSTGFVFSLDQKINSAYAKNLYYTFQTNNKIKHD
jgi:uncharacterized protein (TIGR03032 family)